MKTLSTYLPSGGASSSSPSGTRPVRDPALSRSLPKRFRPGGAAPLRKKSFRHHLDQTLGKNTGPAVLPVVAVVGGPSPSSPENQSLPEKRVRPKSRRAVQEVLSPETGKKKTVPASFPPGTTLSAPDGELPPDTSRPKTRHVQDLPHVRPREIPQPVLAFGESVPSGTSAGPVPASSARDPRQSDALSMEKSGIPQPVGQTAPKAAPLPAKSSAVLKQKTVTTNPSSALFPDSVQQPQRPDETFSSIPRKEKEKNLFEERAPEDSSLSGSLPPAVASGSGREKVPEEKGPGVPDRAETPSSIGPVVSGLSPALSSENADTLRKPVDVPDLSRKVVETVRSGGGEITLRVHPPALGPVQVHVQMDERGKSVSLSIRVRDESVRKALVSSGKMLRNRLEREGFSLARMDVSTVPSAAPMVVSTPNPTDSSPTLPPSSFLDDPGGSQTSFSGRESGGRESPDFREAGGEASVPATARPEAGRRRPVIEDAGYHRIA